MHLQFDHLSLPPLTERAIFAATHCEAGGRLLSQSLRDAGIKNPCVIFPTGPDLIEGLLAVLKGAPPPLLCFLDLGMPGMNGVDVLRWIRLQDALAEVAVTMLASSEQSHDLQEALRFGAQCFTERLPLADELRQIVQEAEKFAATASGRVSFHVPCNRLLALQESAA